jgi:hypothetical protein
MRSVSRVFLYPYRYSRPEREFKRSIGKGMAWSSAEDEVRTFMRRAAMTSDYPRPPLFPARSNA